MKILEDVIIHQTKWLNLVERRYLNKNNKEKIWYMVKRKKQQESLAVLAHNQKVIVIVKNFRVAAGDYVYELPAGLIEEGESISEAALRELKEETGFYGKVIDISPDLTVASGLSDTIGRIVEVEILNEEEKPIAKLEENEDIETIVLKKTDAKDFIEKIKKDNLKITTSLYHSLREIYLKQ